MPHFFFPIFRPKNACQAPKSPNPLPHNNIRVSYEFLSIRYTGYRVEKEKAPDSVRG